jgi:hypothetical protein
MAVSINTAILHLGLTQPGLSFSRETAVIGNSQDSPRIILLFLPGPKAEQDLARDGLTSSSMRL